MMHDPSDDDTALPAIYAAAAAREAIAAIAHCHRALTARALVPAGVDPVLALWNLPRVVLAHGIEPDPVFFFANRMALAAFESETAALLAMPSRLSAEPDLRAERAALLARVARQGFIDDYAGVRISARGRRFAIAQATVWNLADETGRRFGQAACFDAPAHALGAVIEP
jgi:hypothetical protein